MEAGKVSEEILDWETQERRRKDSPKENSFRRQKINKTTHFIHI